MHNPNFKDFSMMAVRLRKLLVWAMIRELIAGRKDEKDSLDLSEMRMVVGSMEQSTAADCAKCKYQAKCSEHDSAHQFNKCEVGHDSQDNAFCSARLCVTGCFGSSNEVDEKFAAQCLRSWSQTEYIVGKQDDAYGIASKVYKAESPDPLFILMDSDDGQDKLDNAHSRSSLLRIVRYFKTQSWWSFCGVTSVVIALNYLEVPPPLYMGVFRWWSETKLLDLYPKLKQNVDLYPQGTTVDELTCVLTGLGVTVQNIRRAGEGDDAAAKAEKFTKEVQDATSSANHRNKIILVNYHRNHVGQTGSGHWSPVAAVAGEWVLIMEVARIKFPPHWVKISHLISGMAERGYLVLSYNQSEDTLNLNVGSLRTCAKTCPGCNLDDHGLSAEEVKKVMSTPRVIP